MDNLKIAFAPLARTTFDIRLAGENAKIARELLVSAGFSIIEPENLITDITLAQQFADLVKQELPDLLIIFQATFADSTMVLSLVQAIDAPVFLWAVPEEHAGGRLRLNSFCGINLAGHALTKAGYQYEFAFSPLKDSGLLDKITSLAQAGRTRNLLRGAKLGRIGENPDGFETCDFDRDQIEQVFGLDVIQFSLEDDIFPQARQVKHNLIQKSDASELEAIVDQVLAENPNAVADVTSDGRKSKKARGFLLGQVMQKTGGRANPKVVSEILGKKLG